MKSRIFASKALPSVARHITPSEFSTESRYGLYHARRALGPQDVFTFGLAISGGVDSMALVALCSKVQVFRNSNTKFHAFVVDHGVRKGSDVEAKSVSLLIESRGIPTRVLTIDWGATGDPAKLPNFESLARKYRYQALGKACAEDGIKALLLAHHQDDQAETVMMRLVNGHRAQGLVGMKIVAGIPECYGIHGLHQSGSVGLSYQSTETDKFLPKPLEPLMIESGGVKIIRPLLNYSKARLVATCKKQKMDWFEDHTNADPSVTMRNAIRHIYTSYALPAALAPQSMVVLSRNLQVKEKHLNMAVGRFFWRCDVTDFDNRTGTVRVLPASIDIFELYQDSSLLSTKDHGLIAAFLLRKIISYVTPDEHVRLSSLHGAVRHVFPEVMKEGKMPAPPPTAFTVSGVQFQRLASCKNKQGKQKYRWLVSRQPHYSSASTRPMLHFPPTAVLEWPSWKLYDGRFWFRIKNLGHETLLIRPFEETDVGQLQLSSAGYERLRHYAPGPLRWTLPVIVLQAKAGRERAIGLPTLDLVIPEFDTLVRYEVRYKSVDVESLRNLKEINDRRISWRMI
ncbi:PP-loop family-domain-containing protein [Bisporella sp. PMI_857]|nr:PP-loop family-domain-containing protein [Bisporella sp. PMI_857]